MVQFSGEGSLPVAQGQSLLEAALSEGVPLLHSCGGNARCSTCRVLILAGAGALTPPNGKEGRLKEKMQKHYPEEIKNIYT